MLYKLTRNLLFMLDAERSHNLALSALDVLHCTRLSKLLFRKTINDPVYVMGLKFNNRVGLAAGLDKNAAHINGLLDTGFGFIEVGTITPKAQPGNDKPRLFRIKPAEAIINRMGFNNDGVDNLLKNVREANADCVLGINIGKNFSTPVEKAVDDYLICFEKVYDDADYITVNISSPNTPGLRALQHGEALRELLTALKDLQAKLHTERQRYVPLAVKIAPDLTTDEIKELSETFLATQVDAVIATNTTFSREGVEGLPNATEQGGLSGAPVFDMSTDVVRQLHQYLGDKIPLIAVGGINTAEKAVEKIRAGASLVQIYSGFIYHGPDLVHRAASAIANMADK